MSKYYNPRIGAATKTTPSAPAKKKAVKAKGGRGGPSKANIAKGTKPKKNPNSAPEKAKGGSKAEIVKKDPKTFSQKFDDKGTKSKGKGGKDGPAKVKENKAGKKDKNYNVGVSKGGVSFGEAFRHFRNSGAKEFTWNGKKYHTKTKEEM